MSLLGFVLVFIMACILTPVGRRSGTLTFLRPDNLTDILRQVSEKGILAVGMTLVILSGGIDLGVGSVLALCATISAVLCVYGQWGTLETALLVLLVGAVLGLFNGAVIARGRVQPFVVTLAMMLAARGLARIISGGAGVGLPLPSAATTPGGYLDRLAGWPTAAYAMIGVAGVGCAILLLTLLLSGLSHTNVGRVLATQLVIARRYGRLVFVIAALGGATGGFLLRSATIPEAAKGFSRAVLLTSAVLGGAAACCLVLWAMFAALRWMAGTQRPRNELLGVSATVVLIAAMGWLCRYLVDLSYAWRTGSVGQAPLSFKLLGLRIGPPIDGWRDILPVPAVIFLLVVAAAHFLMTRTRFGRYIYAIGGNERAALYSGISVEGVKLGVYAIAGFLTALAGIIHCAQLEQGNPNDGMAYELDAIAAVVVGGTLLSGGTGSVIGTLFGVLIIGVIDNIMGLHVDKIDSNWQYIVKGALIVVTVLVQRRRG